MPPMNLNIGVSKMENVQPDLFREEANVSNVEASDYTKISVLDLIEKKRNGDKKAEEELTRRRLLESEENSADIKRYHHA